MRTLRFVAVELELRPALTHPPDGMPGHTDNQRVRGNISRHHGSRGHKSVRAYRDAANDRAVRPKARASRHERAPVVLGRISGKRGPWSSDIRENHAGAAEYISLERDSLVDRDVILNFDVVADIHSGGDKNILPQ